MEGHTSANRYSVSSVFTRPKGISAINPSLTQLQRNVSKLNDIWAKYKVTPPNIISLIRDLQLLSHALSQTIQESQFAPELSSVVEVALRSCVDKSQELLEFSTKNTGFRARKPLSADRLKHLQSLLSDCKIRFLLTEVLLERRTKPISPSAIAEDLAQLHTRDGQTPIGKLDDTLAEPRTDSLLSFKCYSELVGREDILLNLAREYEEVSQVALVGPEGSGKTQIATEYGLRCQSKYPDAQVFWVFCESAAAFEESYRAIAVKFGIPGCDDSKIDILERVRRFLSQERAGKWLLILDNLDDADTLWGHNLTSKSEKINRSPTRLGTYLPSSKYGQTLCLSTDSQIATHFPDAPLTLTVNPLHELEATTLFQSKLPRDLDPPKVTEALAGILEYSPLAICLAAAYMVMMRRDVAQYLVSYKTEALGFLTKGFHRVGGAIGQGTIERSSCFKAWAMSFEQIQSQHPQSANLFALMAMFHHRAIPKNLLYHAWKHGLVWDNAQRSIPDFDIELLPPPPDLVEHQDRAGYLSFSMALATLESFLVIQYDATREMYFMHRAVQASMRSYLQSKATTHLWRSKAFILLSSACQPFRPPHKSHTRSRSNLLLQVEELVHNPHEGDVAGLAKARIMSDVGGWKYSLQQTKTSSTFLRGAYDLQSKLLNAQDARTLRTLVSLAESTSVSDSASAAVPLFVEAISGLKHTLGPGNRKTIFAQLSLCTEYVSCGNTDSASTVHYEAQAAASASLQITPEDRKRVTKRLSELRVQINILLSRQGKRTLSEGDLRKAKSRVSVLKHASPQRIRAASKAFSAQNRVGSLDSIVEMFEVEASRS